MAMTDSTERRSAHIDGNASDLFFNLDFDDAIEHDQRGNFEGFDGERMREKADWFVESLSRLGGPTIASDDLLADFYSRV
jgi:hypothetical protein